MSVAAVRLFEERSPVPVSDRTVAQRMEALQLANAVRSRRAQLKRDLRAGRVWVVQLLSEPPEWLASMKTRDVLLAVPKYGRVKVNRMMAQCGISPSKAVGGLSERQREALLRALGGRQG